MTDNLLYSGVAFLLLALIAVSVECWKLRNTLEPIELEIRTMYIQTENGCDLIGGN